MGEVLAPVIDEIVGWIISEGVKWVIGFIIGEDGEKEPVKFIDDDGDGVPDNPDEPFLPWDPSELLPDVEPEKELKSIQDILNAPDNTIVLIDEIGTIFNARDFQQNQRKGKGDEPEGLPKVLFQHICQVRHRHMVIFGTVQRWGFLEKQLREITNDVTVCSAFPSHPFSRIITNYCYDAEEYNLFYQSPLRPLVPLTGDVWIQTDKLRALYDTKEMVNTMLKMDYVSDEETERNRAFEALGLAAPMDKKTENKLRRNVRNK